MKRIAIDMDGVLADVAANYLLWHERETGVKIEREAIHGLPELAAFPNVKTWLHTEGFFRTLPVIVDSQSVVLELNEKYEVFIVSSATEFPKSLPEKQAWLGEHFPFISWRQMVFCGSKTIVQADIMIDDHFKNLDHFEGQTLLFTAPHNYFAPEGRHQRVHTWREIADILL